MSSEVRERILDTASRLFYAEGIRAVGIDRIVAESGVAKMSLYNHFRSKDDLVVAHLERRHECWKEWFQAALSKRTIQPGEHVQALFDALGEWIWQNNARGCPFINATLELADPNHPAQSVADRHRAFVRDFIAEQLRADGIPPAQQLVDQLSLLMDGAIIGSVMGSVDATRRAAQMADEVIRAYRHDPQRNNPEPK
ncbi:TetR family transcriptional regulator [Sulfobacillus acidophilus TPY]|uniref:Transcriptional regulator, TetR family n=1 Tax=Sulfobacillus acidophilus (strain ATCC 700253 / DSM 10332 / NAL) TaxID=679936 RepID=G8U1R2_SULAD|nr:TetR family transcriptional regulator [Sulfobacillus acidophilus TPY]AEW06990.1 transcriptional regulator, TetR family [Sulfobacillus acidophilus DSM 10332]